MSANRILALKEAAAQLPGMSPRAFREIVEKYGIGSKMPKINQPSKSYGATAALNSTVRTAAEESEKALELLMQKKLAKKLSRSYPSSTRRKSTDNRPQQPLLRLVSTT